METASKPTSNNPEELQEMVIALQQKMRDKDAQIVRLEQKYQYLLEQFLLAQQRQFGKSSEVESNQLELFNEAEEIHEEPEREQETISYKPINQSANHCLKTCHEKPSFMTLMTPIKSVIAVVMTCTQWAKIKVRSLSSFLHRSKSLSIFA